MATSNVRKHAHHLLILHRGKPDERSRVLRDAPESLHAALAEIARLTLSGKLKLTPQQLASVKRHIGAIQKLAHPRTTKTERAAMLRPQRGGFLGFLAPLLAGLVGPLLGKLFK